MDGIFPKFNKNYKRSQKAKQTLKDKNKSEMKLEKGYFSINAISVPFYSKT